MNGTWKDENFIKILAIENLNHDVKRFKVSKPAGYQFIPGEATDIVINQPEWKKYRKPFTFTGLNEWDFLEFTIKIYPKRQRVTHRLNELQVGDELIIHDSFGAFQYKGEGTFIAGGAGVTPFIAIFRQLQKDNLLGNNQLICSNKTAKDIILKEEFEQMLGARFINTLTQESLPDYDHQRISLPYLKNKISTLDQYFYICGRKKMMKDIETALLSMGVAPEKIITEMDFG